METFLSMIHILICIFLVGSILLQSSKGGGLAGMFGGGGMTGGFSSRGAATFLSKMTMYLAIGFAVTSLSIAIISSRINRQQARSAVQEIMESSPMDIIPSIPGTNDPLAMPADNPANQSQPAQQEQDGANE